MLDFVKKACYNKGMVLRQHFVGKHPDDYPAPEQLRISVAARKKLDEQRLPPPTRYPGLVTPPPVKRSNLRSKFHGNYIDNRAEYLKRANAWSINPRPVGVSTNITRNQVRQVLELALAHNVTAARYYGGSEEAIPITDARTLVPNLLGQFLDAVILGYLVPAEEATP